MIICGYEHNIALLLIHCPAFACLRVHLDCTWVSWLYRSLRVGQGIISALESVEGMGMQDAAWIGVIWNVLSCTSFFFHRPCLVGFDIAYASGLHGARLPVLRGKYTYSRTAR